MPFEERVRTWRFGFEEWVKRLGLPPEVVVAVRGGGVLEFDKGSGDLLISWVERSSV